MRTITAFDKINRLGGAVRILPIEQYFGEMDITEEQKRKRKALAEEIDDIVLFIFELYLIAMMHNQAVDTAMAKREFETRLRRAMDEAGISKEVADKYISDVAMEEIEVTASRYRDDEYWTSIERARLISENDANIILHGQEYIEAVEAGKTKKRWITMRDEKVRATHSVVDSAELPIDEPFVVGDSLMMYPGDSSMGASISELANCRCTIEYF